MNAVDPLAKCPPVLLPTFTAMLRQSPESAGADFQVTSASCAQIAKEMGDLHPLHQLGRNPFADRPFLPAQMLQTLVLEHSPVAIQQVVDKYWIMFSNRNEQFLRPILADTPAKMHTWLEGTPVFNRRRTKFDVRFKVTDVSGATLVSGTYGLAYVLGSSEQ